MIDQRTQKERLQQESDNFTTIVVVTAVVGTLGLVASIF